MAKIHHLESSLVDQIAAGEVIDRPASVLKELIENSLDSGANKIDVQIIKGGHDLIQVSDNGCGMSKEDLKLAFMRHATSKIKDLEDLNSITTLGFRGEALPSIASVSMFTAISSEKESNGFEIKINGSEEKSFKPIASLEGTTCKVQNLFYNTPARRKFLKKPETEQAVINTMMRRFMLSRPEVAFKMLSNDKIVYDVSIQNLSERINAIYGSTFKNCVLPVELKKDPYTITGFTGNLSLVKKRQGEQYIFLNGRYIKNRLLNSAIFSAYQSLIQRGEFPFFVIFLEMPPDLFDVNVHPAKLEVRFINEWQIYHVIKTSITTILQDILKVIPDYKTYQHFQEYSPNETNVLNLDKAPSSTITQFEQAPHKRNANEVSGFFNKNGIQLKQAHLRMESTLDNIKVPNEDLQPITDHIWQIHRKYLITEIKSGLIIIDQHVAHERVLFEEAKKAIEGQGFPSQTVLFPQTLKLQPEEYDSLLEITHYLNKIGFRFREFGENTIIIDEIPPDINWGNESQIIREIIDQFISVKKIDPSFIDQIAAIYSCKSAIKAGDQLKPEERIHLIDRLFSTEHPYYCPHGRPIIINLSINELDKRFERIS
jgi:DNA mismatch repair protein MutL|tara:strand:+ start:195 stop:1994 length:1800 start_codon:yes stop_codon:yes gene_type:complete